MTAPFLFLVFRAHVWLEFPPTADLDHGREEKISFARRKLMFAIDRCNARRL